MKTATFINHLKAHLCCPEQQVKKQLATIAVQQNDNTTSYQAFASCSVDVTKPQTTVYVSPAEQQLAQRYNLPANVTLAQGNTKKGNALSDLLGSITTRSEERNLGLLFLDIRNFTSIMEVYPAQTVLHVVRLLFLLFSKSIKENGGRIIETGGDSLYAVFGLDAPLGAVNDSVKASYAILNDLETFNTSYAIPQFGLDIEIGIGLHKGNVAVSYSDLDDLGHLTVMGLPVNIAARLQAATKELNNNIIISDEAYRILEPTANDDAISIRLKGISAPVPVRLLGYPYHSNLFATA
ncbi:adenylate/guanylate cyclase domain-containing protein [Flavobacterium subsaxonicum]|nr:adenylate/guanylate cyclase domain-containing protein [Flavobacterium subsaxonicum]